MIPQIYLRRGKEESLLRRHPWIFSGAIDYIKAEEESEIAEGALVEVFDHKGAFIARGHYQIGSIAVRVLSFEREEIDQAWWNRRLRVAPRRAAHARAHRRSSTTCYRLVHGEGDSLPGLVVDIYGSTAVVQCHSVGMYRSRQQIAGAIRAAYGDRITAIYDKSSQTLPFKADLGAVDGYLWGTSDHASQVVLENGEKFWVNWEKGQKNGLLPRPARKPRAGEALRPGAHRTQHLLLYGRLLGPRPSRAGRAKSARWTPRSGPWRWPRRTCG